MMHEKIFCQEHSLWSAHTFTGRKVIAFDVRNEFSVENVIMFNANYSFTKRKQKTKNKLLVIG